MAQKTKLSSRVRKEVLNYIRILRQEKIPLKEVIVFGSYAKGKAHKWSDIDVCLISPKFKNRMDMFTYLFMKAHEANLRIEPHPYHPKDFVNEDPLVWEIKKTGVRI